MQEWENLKDIYRTCVFNKKELEERLGIDLTTTQSSISVPEELRPFLSRKTIQLKEAANILAGYNPFHWSNQSKYLNDVKGYRASLWDAVDNNILVSKNLITYEDFGQEWRDDITLNKNEVTKWANKYNYNWSLPIDDEIEESNQYNSELLQRIKQLEIELEEQKKNNSESIYIPPLDIIDTGDLTEEINQLKLDNQKLTEQLNEAKQEIEELTTFIQSNNITELTEEYLKSRERNNYYSLIGGLLYLLLRSSSKNLNQNAIILSLQEAFKGEPFSDRSLQDKFANAKRQLITNHPDIKFD